MDRIVLVVQGEDNLSSVLELLDGGVGWEDSFPHEEDEVREGPQLDCSPLADALGVFTQLGAEVKAQGDQVGGLTGFGI